MSNRTSNLVTALDSLRTSERRIALRSNLPLQFDITFEASGPVFHNNKVEKRSVQGEHTKASRCVVT
jgi:hypothetical protein